MSQPYPGYPSPNPGGPPKFNPDTRPLPEGWITQYDTTYNAWFYVNTRAHPPKSEWKHPADLYGVPPQAFAPPGGPPPASGGSAQSYYQGTDAASPYPQQPQQPAYGAAPGAYSPYPAGSPYPQQPQQQQYAQTPGGSSTKGPLGALGGAAAGAGLLGKLLSHGSKPQGGGGGSHGPPLGGVFSGGSHGGSQSYGAGGYGGGYGGYGQQPVYGAAPKKSHAGRNAMLAGGGGLLGGLLIADAIDDIGDDRREEAAYEQGYQDGNDGDWGGGGDDFGDF